MTHIKTDEYHISIDEVRAILTAHFTNRGVEVGGELILCYDDKNNLDGASYEISKQED